ncbi:MAG: hypothetical protein ACREKM_05345 [Longimicrobiales bacterium]
MSATSDDTPGPLVQSMLQAMTTTSLTMLVAGEVQPLSRSGGAFALEPASPDHLARAGFAALRDTLAAGNDRSAAFELLTADALITQACEVAATGELPASLSPARFAALLEDAP